ncbi:MAG TPA: hypothetical protein VMS21_04310, partial [Methylomirabilota bacterium]|nr:hypothetical protein [Methylomirabilota bacterium]
MPDPSAPSPGEPGLNPLERCGALMSRLLHELTNRITVIAGNAQLVEVCADDPARQSEALQTLIQEADHTGALLDQFAALRREIGTDLPAIPLEQIQRALGAALPAGWRLEPWDTPAGGLRFPLSWVSFCARAIATGSGAVEGTLRLSVIPLPAGPQWFGMAPPHVASPRLFSMEFSYSGGRDLLPQGRKP